MSALFIADVHLAPARPEQQAAFRQLISESSHHDAVYLLGDVFDLWLGDDVSNAIYAEDLAALKALSNTDTKVYCQYGNHDFVMRERFEQAAGCELLPDPYLIQLEGKRILLSHGDLLCTEDESYMRYRRVVRNPWFERAVLALPRMARQAIADKIRSDSATASASKDHSITDVNPVAAERWLRHYRADWLIHGHTHRPCIHEQIVDGRETKRVVVGDWYSDGVVAVVDSDGVRLISV